MNSMLTGISRQYWISLLVRGIVAIIFGILALVWTGPTLLALAYLFGAFALIDGIVAVVVAIQERAVAPRWWVLLIEGIAGILLGIFTFLLPLFAIVALLYVIAAWAIVTGIIEMVGALSLGRAMNSEWTLLVAGLLSILLGIVLILFPGPAILSLIWLIGIYAIVFGIVFIVRAFQYRNSSTLTTA